MLPSIRNYERDLLKRLEHVGRLQVISAFAASGHSDPRDLLLRGTLMVTPSGIVGGALYNGDLTPIGSFGEAPEEAALKTAALRSTDGGRYDVTWTAADTGLPFIVVGRLDSSWIKEEVYAFIGRILGLVLLISAVVWATTLVIVGFTVFRPVLAIRSGLAQARLDPANADRHAVAPAPDDELGDAIRDVNALFHRVARTYREELWGLTTMAERAGNAIIAFDVRGRVTFANPACLALCGCRSAVELQKEGLPRIDFGDGGAETSIPASLSQGSYSREVAIIGKEGRRVHCVASASLIAEDESSPFHFYASIEDVSDLHAARERLANQNKALEHANKAKSDFLARMSHELRTPLNAIIGFSEMMVTEIKGPLGSPAYRDYASDILASGRHLLMLVTDILDLARIEAGSMPLNESEVDVTSLLQSAARAAEALARGTDIRVTCVVQWALPHAFVDERRLRQILLNLVGNAVKFGRPGGRVILQAGLRDGQISIVVRDDGIGMAAEDIPRAMQPFNQLEGPLSRHYEGAGLGLGLAQALARLHDADMTVESRKGVGTTVTLTLPRQRILVPPAPCSGPASSSLDDRPPETPPVSLHRERRLHPSPRRDRR